LIKVEIPKWRIDDPFGRNALKSVCYDLKKALCDCEGYKSERDEILKAKSAACDGLAEHINDALALAKTLDEMRKQLAASNKELREENAILHKEVEQLATERDQCRHDYAELEAEHEKLVRGLTDKEVEA
jgi:septal ring factor EnvC (AmiA/AmiB activator)